MKKRRIHAAETQPYNHASLPVLLLRRELGCTAESTSKAARSSTERQLLQSTLQLIGLQVRVVSHVLVSAHPHRAEHLLTCVPAQPPSHTQDSFDTHDPAAAPSFGPSYMQQPSAVAEMALHQGLLFVLLQSGLCPVFDTAPGAPPPPP